MPQQELNGAHIGAGFKQVRSKRVTQRVRGNGFSNPRSTMGFLACHFDGASGNRLTDQIARKQPQRRAYSFPIGAQFLKQTRREHDVAILAPLPLVDA